MRQWGSSSQNFLPPVRQWSLTAHYAWLIFAIDSLKGKLRTRKEERAGYRDEDDHSQLSIAHIRTLNHRINLLEEKLTRLENELIAVKTALVSGKSNIDID